MDEVLKFLKENPTYYLATAEGDQPRVRPFGTIAKFEGRLYFSNRPREGCVQPADGQPQS